MKKVFSYLLAVIVMCTVTTACSSSFGMDSEANDSSTITLNIGDYILMGKYSDAPILWRYVADDETGMLILSDKLLCEKNFGTTNFWAGSALRKWLNSDVSEGEEKWGFAAEIFYEDVKDEDGRWVLEKKRRPKPYAKEKGFLHEDNFSLSERTVMRPVIQWTMLSKEQLDLAENGETRVYKPVKGWHPGGPFSEPPGGEYCYSIHELPEMFFGAAHRVEDTVFLLDEMQIYNVWSRFGTVNTVFPLGLNMPSEVDSTAYFLRTAEGREAVYCTVIRDNIGYGRSGATTGRGIRPAFYLDESTTQILSGSGTEEDPYVIDGKKNRI